MAVSTAQARSPGISLHPAAPDDDRAALHRLAQWCARTLCPLVAVAPPDGLFLDTTGTDHLFGGEPAMLAHIATRFASAGINVRAAIAPTPGAAHALARYGAPNFICVSPVCVSQSGLADALAPLPVAALRLPAASLDILAQLGFAHIGPLSQTARAPLARRLGAGLLTRLDQAYGRIAEPINPLPDIAAPLVHKNFADPVLAPAAIAHALHALLAQLLALLTSQGLGATALTLTCTRSDATSQILRIGISSATTSTPHLSRLLRACIADIAPEPGIDRITLHATTQILVSPASPTLLAPDTNTHTDLADLIDIVANRVKNAKIFRALPTASDIPERAARNASPLARITTTWPPNLPRPTRLLTPPHPIDVLAALPDQPPAQFIWCRQRHRIIRADGPERIFGEWWINACETHAVRDYFQVEDTTGQRFWLFRRGDGTNHQTGDLSWYLHGLFA